MTSTTPTRTTSAAVGQHRRSLLLPGLAGAVAAAAAATIVAALGMAAGVAFEVPDGSPPIPLLAFTNLGLVFSLVGLAIAFGLRRWNARPASTFLRLALVLTAASLVPPFVVGASLATALALVLAHLVTAAIMIPVVVSRLAD